MTPELAARLAHSADERVAVADLELAVDVYRRVALRLLG
jgi:acetylornithine deacetylase/succinyl-diaminopimelate desuccinylase-like protein